jgi:hypothetical protein
MTKHDFWVKLGELVEEAQKGGVERSSIIEMLNDEIEELDEPEDNEVENEDGDDEKDG